MPAPTHPSTAERRLSLMLLLVLAGIAVTLLLVQHRYDPGAWQERPDALAGARSGESAAIDFAALGLQPLTPPENYDAATLSDKINGKAELYLAAGFVSLATRRLAPQRGADGAFLEWYLYDMGRRRNAFAVFSVQKRPERETLDLTADAYRAANGLFMVHGRYYVEIIAADASDIMTAAVLETARAFVARTPVQEENLIETKLFPDAERVPDSIALIAANAFGLEGLDWIYTAQYRLAAGEALAFLARRSSPAEAAAARDAFAAYFIEYGGEPVDPPAGLQAASVIKILDAYEIVLTHGPFLLGVHEAVDSEQALDLAARMLSRVREAAP